MKDLVKKQDKFIDEIFTRPGDNTLCYLTGDDKRRIMKLISNYVYIDKFNLIS